MQISLSSEVSASFLSQSLKVSGALSLSLSLSLSLPHRFISSLILQPSLREFRGVSGGPEDWSGLVLGTLLVLLANAKTQQRGVIELGRGAPVGTRRRLR